MEPPLYTPGSCSPIAIASLTVASIHFAASLYTAMPTDGDDKLDNRHGKQNSYDNASSRGCSNSAEYFYKADSPGDSEKKSEGQYISPIPPPLINSYITCESRRNGKEHRENEEHEEKNNIAIARLCVSGE